MTRLAHMFCAMALVRRVFAVKPTIAPGLESSGRVVWAVEQTALHNFSAIRLVRAVCAVLGAITLPLVGNTAVVALEGAFRTLSAVLLVEVVIAVFVAVAPVHFSKTTVAGAELGCELAGFWVQSCLWTDVLVDHNPDAVHAAQPGGGHQEERE